MARNISIGLCLAGLVCGCVDSAGKDKKEDQPKTGIFGKKTQDIGKFDPNAANQVVSDQKIRATDPITGPLSAYGPMVEKVSIAAVDYSIQLFNAAEGRYPKDHEEFMEKIIKANNIQLPVLPYKGRYQYDEATH